MQSGGARNHCRIPMRHRKNHGFPFPYRNNRRSRKQYGNAGYRKYSTSFLLSDCDWHIPWYYRNTRNRKPCVYAGCQNSSSMIHMSDDGLPSPLCCSRRSRIPSFYAEMNRWMSMNHTTNCGWNIHNRCIRSPSSKRIVCADFRCSLSRNRKKSRGFHKK